MMNNTKSISEYISEFPKSVQTMLRKMRQVIKAVAPGATEDIKYGMPTFVLNGNLVHFAAYEKHIGFYPTPSAITAFKKELAGYKTSKGAIQFPIEKPIPYSLVTKIVKFRVKENMGKAKRKTSK